MTEQKVFTKSPDGMPINAMTGKPYAGQNVAELLYAQDVGGYSEPVFLTFAQARMIGRCVRKGEKGCAQIVRFVKKKSKKKTTKKQVVPKRYVVFNIEQTEEVEA